ncbi:MAG: histidine kinase [Blautia sp.]|nr:histidine kinase [Blautia sp.]MDY2898316.1 histidine kinase [Candidatus Limivivens sp.]
MFQRICIKIRSSLTTKFFVTFLFLLIVPLIILTQIFAVKLQSVLQKKELSSTREKISYAQEQFDQLFSDMDRIATSLILDWHVIRILSNSAKVPTYEWFQDYKSLNSILELLNSTSDYKYNITVVGYDDRIYHSTASYNSMLHTDFALIQRIMTGNGNPIIFNRALEGYDDVSMITLGRSVYQKGSYLGTILVEVPVSYLDNLLLPFENDSGILYVLEDSQRILYSSRSDDSLLISENLSTALRQKLSSVSINHTDFLLTQMPSSQHGLSIATLITKDSVFRESSEVIQLFILAFFLVIAATVFGIIFLTHTFTRNILSLNQAVSRFGKNADFYINLPIHSADEIGQLTSGVIDMSHRIKTLLEEIQKEEEEKRILEFNSLQSQINPHMIYNTLNTITWLAEAQNIYNIQEVSSSFAHLLRSLSNQGSFVTIKQEISYLQAYINIKKYNLLCTVQTDFQVDPATYNCRILKLLLQPIVENAMIHGFSGCLDDCLINISICLEKEMLFIDISDNGNGMSEEKIHTVLQGAESDKNTFLRIGVHNIIERLRLQYGEQASFSIISAPGCGTTVSLSFPAEVTSPNGSKS